MKIKIKYPIPAQKPRYAELWVNGVRIAEWINGKDKKYKNPEKWAKEAVKKRNRIIDRNIERLRRELKRWEKEKQIINGN